MFDRETFLKNIESRQLILDKVVIQLKEKFVGIDNIIDEFIRNVRVWYLMPELQMRPLIINLWGPTGCGKTDMIRTFVSLIEYNNKFVEIQMDATESYLKKISDYLDRSDIDENEPSILFLDEMQRFRSIDEHGNTIQQEKFQDLWMLLSDGKFESTSKNRSDLMYLLFDSMYDKDYSVSRNVDDDELKEIESNKKRTFKTPFYSAKRLKTLLRLDNSIEDIMKWDDDKKMELILSALSNDRVFEGICYSKMLIFISGNLDEAYFMADDVNNADIDADIYHNHSLRLNITDIKAALSTRFKPEQVSRFGNIHLIYPCLNKSNFEEIITRKLNILKNKIISEYDIHISFDNSINLILYSNGVFPAQGVRPLLSTINHVLETSLPTFIYHSIKHDIKEFNLKHTNGKLLANFTDEINCDVPLVIDKIKQEKNIDDVSLASVHEVGHALVYAVLFKLAPTQIIGRTASTDYAGFIGTHAKFLSKNLLRDEIIVDLAGQAAEEIVFTDSFKSYGSAEDIRKATSRASDYIRNYGFDGYQSNIMTKQEGRGANYDIDPTNKLIEQMLQECKLKAKDLIIEHMPLYKELVQRIIENDGDMRNEEFIDILKQYKIDVKNASPQFRVIENYHEKLTTFLE